MVKKRIIEYAIKNWKSIAIVLLSLIVVGKTRYDYHLMETTYQTQIDSATAQIEGLKEIHKQEIQAKQILMESYLESLAAIESDFENARAELEATRADKKKEYVNKFKQDKQQLAKDIQEKFGITYAP